MTTLGFTMPSHTTPLQPKPGIEVERAWQDQLFEESLARRVALRQQFPARSTFTNDRWIQQMVAPPPMMLCRSCGKRPVYAKGLCHYEYNKPYYRRFLLRHPKTA